MTTKGHSLDEMIVSYERLLIMETLRRNDWNRRKAAVALQIPLRRILRRMAALHFDTQAIPRDAPGRRKRPESLQDIESSGESTKDS
jgi:DNA-binding NtrC family response regulator